MWKVEDNNDRKLTNYELKKTWKQLVIISTHIENITLFYKKLTTDTAFSNFSSSISSSDHRTMPLYGESYIILRCRKGSIWNSLQINW